MARVRHALHAILNAIHKMLRFDFHPRLEIDPGHHNVARTVCELQETGAIVIHLLAEPGHATNALVVEGNCIIGNIVVNHDFYF